MRRDIWIFLFVTGLVLFGWPFLEIFHTTLPGYLFGAWLVFIALLFIASLSSEKEEGGN